MANLTQALWKNILTPKTTNNLNEAAKKFGVKLYFVGGLVRDLLLGNPLCDVDIVVEGDAVGFCESLENIALGEILSVHNDFGTCKMKIDQKTVDFASTREENYPVSGCLPVVKNIGCPLKNDVSRRDFTINSIALDLETGAIIDYLGGVEDLNKGILRILHPDSFIDDPTRILRALDFELRLRPLGASSSRFKLADEVKFAPSRDGLSTARVDLTLKKVLKNADAYKLILERGLYKIFQDEKPLLSPKQLEAALKFAAEPAALYFKAVKNEIPALMSAKTDFEIYKVLCANLKENEIKPLPPEIAPKITGDDLKKLGIPQSPKIGIILDKILEEKLNNPKSAPKTLQEELEYAKKLAKTLA